MGNNVIKDGGSVVDGISGGGGAELRQPGKPLVKLATERKSYRKKRERQQKEQKEQQLGFDDDGETPACVSDDILLTWSPCTRHDKGYEIEMWDLGLQEWVRVAATDDHKPECILSNILSGILYRFRVTAITKEGNVSFPSDPSDAFVLDMPGVQIAPYWIQTPPTIVSLTMDQTLTLQAKALGTPYPNFHWYKDHQEELFIGENLSHETNEELSQLTITNVQPSDGGVYTCTAVNTVGKCVWETVVDLKAKPTFTLPPSMKKSPIKFQEDEIIRVKLPLIGVPEPTLKLERLDEEGKTIWTMAVESDENDKEEPKLQLLENFAVLRIESAQIRHSGRWCVTATNPIGSDIAVLEFAVHTRPNPPTKPPAVEELSADSVQLSWEEVPLKFPNKKEANEKANDVASVPATDAAQDEKENDTHPENEMNYQVEYNREKWDIWLKGRITKELTCTIGDLVPGSYYRFRVCTVTGDGISEPGPSSEAVFLGAPVEDEVFGLPGGNYPKESSRRTGPTRGRLFNYGNSKPSRRQHSWDNLDTSTAATAGTTTVTSAAPSQASDTDEERSLPDLTSKPIQALPVMPPPSHGAGSNKKPLDVGERRHTSLDREVYYLDDRREEVVTYSAPLDSFGKKLGALARKRGLSEAEEEVYRNSLGSLCEQIMKSSQTSLNKNEQRRSRERSRQSGTPDVEKVFVRLAEQQSTQEKASVMQKYDLTKQEKRTMETSLTELCNRLKTISQQNLARNTQAAIGSASHLVNESTVSS